MGSNPLLRKVSTPGFDLFQSSSGETVGAFIEFVAGVALDPAPVDLVAQPRLIQPPPEVLVLDRALAHGAPAARLPKGQPLGDAALHVLAVRVQLDLARTFERVQRLDRGGELHAVVGGGALAAPDFPLVRAEHQHGAPAARSRIPATGAVGVDQHLGVLETHGEASNRWTPARCTASLRSYSIGSFGLTSAPSGVARQS